MKSIEREPQMSEYVSVDIEASGPVPGDYSLLSIGACFTDKPRHFYTELKSISASFLPEALQISGLDMEVLTKTGKDPITAMSEFAEWLDSSKEISKPLDVKAKKSPLNKIEEELSKIPAMKQKQQEAYERGPLTIEEYGDITGRLRKLENDLYTEKTRYSPNDKSKNTDKVDKQKLWKAVKNFNGFWKSLDFLGKKQFLKLILKKVDAGNSQVLIEFTD